MTKLWLLVGGLWAQAVPSLTRLVYYDDGRIYWVREILLNRPDREITLKVPGTRPPSYFLPQPDYRIQRYMVAPDTLLADGDTQVGSLRELLSQSVGASLTLAYLSGNEWEETSGTLEGFTSQGMVLLRRASGEQVALPQRLIRLVRRGSGPYQQVLPAQRIHIAVDTVRPLLRIALAGWDSLPSWEAQHYLQLATPTRATLLSWIHLPPSFLEGSPVELFLVQRGGEGTASQTWHLPLQVLTPWKAQRILLLQAELPYTEVYRAALPDLVESLEPLTLKSWQGWAERSIQLLNTERIPLPAGSVSILDEGGLPIAESYLPLTLPTTAGYISLRPNQAIQLRLQETETRREKTRDAQGFSRVILQGSLRIQNSTTREVRLLIQKPITGRPLPDQVGFARTEMLPERKGPNPRYLLQWEMLLRPGATETLEYTYELLIPTPK
uniref:DUF4139 domain-containing protein n=1 Tax=uncultured Bacteroidota bacterium TaxID=152509 RepID=H5SK54_9BACT|nr:hypothetical protein HGMM_F40B03C28 [uncultured Bacteroidetes bacterium]